MLRPLVHRARHSPARHNLALFKLLAVFRAKRVPTDSENGENLFVYILDRHQSSTECHLRGLLVLATLTGYGSALFSSRMIWPLAIVAALIAAWVVMNTIFFLMAVPLGVAAKLGLFANISRESGQTFLFEVLLFSFALASLQSHGWVRRIGFTWISLLFLNFLAALVIRAFAENIRKVETTLGGNEFVS